MHATTITTKKISNAGMLALGLVACLAVYGVEVSQGETVKYGLDDILNAGSDADQDEDVPSLSGLTQNLLGDDDVQQQDADDIVGEDQDSTLVGTDAMDSAFSEDSASQGTSSTLSEGDNVEVQYRLRLANGKEVYRQWGDGDGGSFNFELGAGHVIPGFDSVISGMKVGQEMDGVTISADQAYGAKGFEAMGIPPNADLVYDLKVVSKN